jgi:hypothetical protein
LRCVELDDLEVPALVREPLAHLGDPPEARQHEAGERLVVAIRHGKAGGVEHLVAVQRARQQPLAGALDASEAVGWPVVLVVDLADDLLEDVLERDDASGAPVLVDDDGEVAADPPQLGQEVGEVARLRHDERRHHQPLDEVGAALLVRHAVDVLDVDHAAHVVEVGAHHREAGVPGGHGALGKGRHDVVDRQGDHRQARH